MLSIARISVSRRLDVASKAPTAKFTSQRSAPNSGLHSLSSQHKATQKLSLKASFRRFSLSSVVKDDKKDGRVSFMDGGEFHRLNDTSQGKIDEFGNFQTAEGVAMPTQSSGGLTKRNNADISELDIFSGEGAVISAYSESGFVINEEYTEGSVLMFPKRFWSWKPKTLDEITLEMLAPIWLHNPVPQILVLGTGPTLVRPPPELLKFLLVRGIATEVCATPNAISTFNFLVQEERPVAGAFLPVGVIPERKKKQKTGSIPGTKLESGTGR